MDFDDLFRSLTGFAPYQWQRALYARMLDGDLPDSLPLPTGTGKTAVIPIWLIAQANNPALPRRLVYVVDRRAIVDQSSGLAEQIANIVADRDNTSSEEIRAALHLPDGGLSVSTLRGQHIDNRRWLRDPAAPAIVVGTVDMIGSRLLFGGYGVSPNSKSMHAGMIGHDSLIVLDEAHLSQPFARLLKGIQHPTICGENTSPRPAMTRMVLSATPGDKPDSQSPDGLDVSLHEDIAARLDGEKWLTISPAVSDKELVDALASVAWGAREHRRVLIYCDRRDTAVKVEKALQKLIRKEKHNAHTRLFSGQTRVRERELLAEWLHKHGYFTYADNSDTTEHSFLIATSAGECGVDLDADALVCDLVPLERMVQRFGRVNRSGNHASDLVVIPALPSGKNDKHLHYSGADLDLCMSLLKGLPLRDEKHSASTRALFDLQTGADPDALASASTPSYPSPALDRATVDLWTMTSLPNDAEPEGHSLKPALGPWLRGWEPEEQPQTRLLWRRHLPINKNLVAEKDSRIIDQFFAAAPPHLSEILELPAALALKSLSTLARQRLKAFPQEEGLCAVVLLSNRSDETEVIGIEKLALINEAKPRDRDRWAKRFSRSTVVAWAELGGLDPTTGQLDPSTFPTSKSDEGVTPSLDGDEDTWDEQRLEHIGYRVVFSGETIEGSETDKTKDLRKKGWMIGQSTRLNANPDEDTSERLTVAYFRGLGQATEPSSHLASKPQTLAQHSSDCASVALALAKKLNLDERQQQIFTLAGRYHDSGKDRSLWQRTMNAPIDGGPWAKTPGGGNPRKLEGYRHEFGSLMDVLALERDDPSLQALSDDDRDLLRHLITAHHGRGRPFIQATDPNNPPSKTRLQGLVVAQRFEYLQRRYGPWQLAWWESLLRSADWAASAEASDQENAP